MLTVHRGNGSWTTTSWVKVMAALSPLANARVAPITRYVTSLPTWQPTSMPFNVGHLVLALSVVFFCLASYAVLFSAFLPLTGILVLALPISPPDFSPLSPSDPRCPRERYSLQVLRHPPRSHRCILCDCKLGRMAILSQYLICKFESNA